MSKDPQITNRRSFLGGSILAGLALTGCASPDDSTAETSGRKLDACSTPSQPLSPEEYAKVQAGTALPCGQIGDVRISRLIAGGNLLSGWCHQRDLLFVRQLAEAYLTEQKQFDTLQLMEAAGINMIMVDMIQMPIVNKYKKQRGGRMRTIASVRQDWGAWDRPNIHELKTEISRTIDQGPDLLYLHGGYCDRLVQSGQPQNIVFLAQALSALRERGYLAGLGSHALEVPMECDKRGIAVDYYVKTFHHDRYWSATPRERRKRFCVDGPTSLDHNEFHDNIFCIDPEETAAYMLGKRQPFIAFKVLAAGAIQPKSAFTWAFENGADFLAVGMFDFNVGADVSILKQVLKDVKRQRPWAG